MKPRKNVFRKIAKLLDGRDAIKMPLMELECGHQVRTEATFKAQCEQCSREREHKHK